MRSRPSIRRRFLLAALIPLAVGIALAWGITSLVFNRSLERRVSAQLEQTADFLAGGIVPPTAEVLRRIAALQQTEAAVVDSDGRAALSTGGALVEAALEDFTGGAALPDGTYARRFASEPAVMVIRAVAKPGDPRFSRVLVVASLRDARVAAQRAAWVTGAAAALLAMLMIALLYYLVRGITRPLVELAGVADQIAEGGREVRLQQQREDEIGTLGKSLQDLATRLGRYEAELREQSRLTALGEMAARIAHEIRNPLTGLKMHLELLGERAEAEDRRTVQQLLGEVRRLELIVESSLGLARSGPPEFATAELRGLVEEVTRLMEPSLRHKGIELETRLEGAGCLAMDRGRIKQALLNLLANAADALPQGGRILASVEEDRALGVARVAVEDTGPGIDPAAVAGTGPVGASGKPFGLGLGLRLCREIASEHGGRLLVESSPELGGARLVLELPLASPA